MSSRSAVWTYRDYAALPDDGRRHELHDGELSVTPAPGTRHQRALRELAALVGAHVKSHGLGEMLFAPVEVILSDTTVVQPDLVYVDHGRAGLVSDRGIEGPPTLAVEIVSPSTVQVDRGRKLELYARHGVPFVWLVDPDGRWVEAYTLEAGTYRLAVRATGADPVALPPFPHLPIVPDALWP